MMLVGSKFNKLIFFAVSIFFLSSCSLDVKIDDLFDLETIKSSIDDQVNEGESLEINLSFPEAINDITVSYEIVNRETDSEDFESDLNQNSLLTAENVGANFSIPIKSDSLYEKDESFEFKLLIQRTEVNESIEVVKVVTIKNSDPQPLLSLSQNTFDEDQGTVNLQFNLDTVSAEDAIFTLETNTSSAIMGIDFQSLQQQIVIPAGSLSQNVSLTIIDDSLDEFDETILLQVVDSSDVDVTQIDQGAITILDDDVAPTVSFSDITISENGLATITATLFSLSAKDITFNYETADGTALAGLDFIFSNNIVTIPSGQLTQDISVSVIDDSNNEADETFNLNFSNPNNATLLQSSVSVTINDNDLPSLSISDVSVNEATGSINFTVSLSAVSAQNVSFDWATSDGSAVSVSDYVSSGQTETILAGSTTKILSVTVVDDSIDEFDEVFNVNLSNPINASIADNQGVGTIQDNDSEPSLSISDVTIAEGSNLVFNVSLSSASGKPVSFDFASTNNSATDLIDYTGVSGSHTLAAGETIWSIYVGGIDDTIDEADETFEINLTNANNATVSDAQAIGTIQDNDSAPILSVSDVTVLESEGSVNFTISLDSISGKDVSFDFITSAGSALANVDYTTSSNTGVTISAGNISTNVTISISDDSIDEVDETFSITLSNLVNASSGTLVASATIEDDDDPPAISVGDITVIEGNSAFVPITLSAVSGKNVSFNYITSDSSAYDAVDYNTISGSHSINAGSTSTTLEVITIGNTKDEASRTFNFTLSSISNAAVADDNAVVTIDDDDLEPSLSISDASVTEGGNLSFTVTISTVSGKDISFDWVTSDGTAVSGNDYTSVNTTSETILAGSTTATLLVVTSANSVDEGDRNLNVNLSNPSNVSFLDGAAVGTIQDDDSMILVINDVTVDESENAVLTISSVGGVTSTNTVTVKYYIGAGATATADVDFVYFNNLSAKTATITPGNSSTTATVEITQDTVDENAEYIPVNLMAPVNASIGDPFADIILNDDDALPTFLLSGGTVEEGNVKDFQINLSNASQKGVSFDWKTLTTGTAISGVDYTAVNTTTVNIPNGDTSINLSVSTIEDSDVETNETFYVQVDNQVNATVQTLTELATINDDDVDVTPPNAVSNFVGPAIWNSLTTSPNLSWDANIEADLAYYEIEVRKHSDNSSIVSWTNVGNVTSYQFTSGIVMLSGESYYANIRAVDTSANASSGVRVDIGSNDYWVVLIASSITKVVAGGNHSCAIVNGGAKCWGLGTSGQLGDGNATNSATPVQVTGLESGVTDIALGLSHSCAIQNGAAKCWGVDNYGHLGTGSATGSQSSPVQVLGLSSGVTALTAGTNHTCAVHNGSAKCWGLGQQGRLGNNQYFDQYSPVQVVGLTSGVTDIAAYDYHSCAVHNGAAKCWGAGNNGALGDGLSTTSPSPVQVSGLTSGVESVTTGMYYSCAIQNAGVKCWGRGGNGAMGNASYSDQTTPVSVTGLSSGVTNLDSGLDHVCAVHNGALKCWGYGGFGRLGDGFTSNRNTPVNVTSMTTGGVQISAGWMHTCGLANGIPKCWGHNNFSKLGDETTTQRNTAVSINSMTSGGVTKIVTKETHSCLINEGAAYCWGLNDEGQLGDGSTVDHMTPSLVSGLTSGVQDIVVGDYHSCALVNGGVKCWGANWSGQVGDGSTMQRNSPTNVSGLLTNVSSISAGSVHTCARVGGALQCWGENGEGQLGDNSTTTRTSPVTVSGLTSNVQKAEAYSFNSCAVTDGQVQCWGINTDGQTGKGATSTRELVPVVNTSFTSDVLNIALGDAHMCALVSGSIQCLGSGSDGQLGYGSTFDSLTSVVVNGFSSGATSLISGSYHSCSVDSTGQMKCWGGNSSGQLGNNSTTNSSAPVSVNGFIGVNSFGLGVYTSCGIKNGEPYCWGKNSNGQIGDGSTADKLIPTMVDISGL